MNAPDEKGSHDILTNLDENVGRIVAQLSDCRKENELLKSELSSLQNILRSCKLPGTEGISASDPGISGNGFTYAEKLQVKQKLVLILQKIEMELRSDQVRQ
jgi:chaperonin cofactor prefoldin